MINTQLRPLKRSNFYVDTSFAFPNNAEIVQLTTLMKFKDMSFDIFKTCSSTIDINDNGYNSLTINLVETSKCEVIKLLNFIKQQKLIITINYLSDESNIIGKWIFDKCVIEKIRTVFSHFETSNLYYSLDISFDANRFEDPD